MNPDIERIESFRRAKHIPRHKWAAIAGIHPKQLEDYLNGRHLPRSGVLAKLVRAARQITGVLVNASELYDLGEDERVCRVQSVRRPPNPRRFYDTPFDRFLRREGILPSQLARESGLPRQVILRKRTGAELPSIPVIEGLVRALRRMGYDVRATDLFDVGEDP
jgi:transcriptional regulator with XRE-family HTH domain